VAGEVIEATPGHPFWVIEGEGLMTRPLPEHCPKAPGNSKVPGRWVDAGYLQIADRVLLKKGKSSEILCVATRQVKEVVYNLQVKDLHCYAVGANQILVHNNSVLQEDEPPIGKGKFRGLPLGRDWGERKGQQVTPPPPLGRNPIPSSGDASVWMGIVINQSTPPDVRKKENDALAVYYKDGSLDALQLGLTVVSFLPGPYGRAAALANTGISLARGKKELVPITLGMALAPRGGSHPNAAKINKLHSERVRNRESLNKLNEALENVRGQQPLNEMERMGHDLAKQQRMRNIKDAIEILQRRQKEIEWEIDVLLRPPPE
jgi:hypothetical protein